MSSKQQVTSNLLLVSLTPMQLSTLYRWLEWAGFEHHTFDEKL